MKYRNFDETVKYFATHILHKVNITRFLPLHSSVLFTAFCPSTTISSYTALCPSTALFVPLPPLWHSAPSTAHWLLYSTLSPVRPSFPLYPLRPSASSAALYLSTALRLSTALCPSTALCTLYRPLPPQRPSVPSTRHVFLPLFREMMMFFRCFAKHVLPKQAISRNSETSETTPLV